MPMINGIPETVTDFNVYDSASDEERLVGVGSEMTLPTLEAVAETLSLAGVAGEFDAVTPGHFGPLDLEVPFTVLTGQSLRLASGDFANLTVRGAIKSTDVASGTIRQSGIRVNVRGPVKAINLGKLGKAELRAQNQNGTSCSFELMGDTGVCAGQICALSGFGDFDGNYCIDTAEHVKSGVYKTRLTAHRCLEGY